MGLFIGINNVAGNLLCPVQRLGIGPDRVGGNGRLSRLNLQTVKIDGGTQNARRRPGFEPHQPQSERPQRFGKSARREHIVRSRRIGTAPDDHAAVQIGSRRNHR